MHTASLLISLDWIIYKPAESIGLAGKKEGALSGHTKESFSKNRARESSFTNESISIYYLLKRAHFLGLDPGVQKFHPVTLPQRHCPYQVKRLRSRASRTMKTFSTSMELHLSFWASQNCFDKDGPFLCTNIPRERNFLPPRKRMNNMGSKTSSSLFRLGYWNPTFQVYKLALQKVVPWADRRPPSPRPILPGEFPAWKHLTNDHMGYF